MNIFQGGFLGLDNIGVFDRSAPLPTGGYIEQSDGTSWMAMYTLNLLGIALELSKEDRAYEDVASKFWEHFIHIAHAMSHRGQNGTGLWNEEDGFFYDVLRLPDGNYLPMKIRSMVGLIPLFAVETLEPELLERLPGFKRRLEWFIDNRPDLIGNVACMRTPGMGERRLLSIATQDQLRQILNIHVGRARVPFALRHPSALPGSPRPSLPAIGEWHGSSRGLRAGGIQHRTVRWQFQLARPDLVSSQFPAHRVAAKVPLLPWR